MAIVQQPPSPLPYPPIIIKTTSPLNLQHVERWFKLSAIIDWQDCLSFSIGADTL